jgi:quercetin dioxygenase-like cupin family protein
VAFTCQCQDGASCYLEPAPIIKLAALFTITTSLLPATALLSAQQPAHSQPPPTVVPAREHLEPTQGPTHTQGVLAVKRLGAQPLGLDFSALQGKELRLRELTIAPGGSIALHRHDQRPGVAYILQGQMTERRGPGFSPRVIGPGETAFESTGITHWWRNEGTAPAKALVVDIVPLSTP